jgi:hypothetical protein
MRSKSRKAIVIAHTMGLLLLITSILVPATFVSQGKPFSKPQLRSLGIDSVFQEINTKGLSKPDHLKLLKIHMILNTFKTGLSSPMEAELTQLIFWESLQYNYDPELILALILTESSFYNWSKSKVGALGLMQILPTTGRSVARAINLPWHGEKTLLNPDLNIKLGTHYLAELHQRFGDLKTALAAYNYGPSRISKMKKRCDRVPQAYSMRILNAYERFQGMKLPDLTRKWNPDQLMDFLKSSPPTSVRI